MPSGLQPKKLTVAGTTAEGTIDIHGFIMAVRVERSTGSPVVTIQETYGTKEVILNGVTFAADRTESPTKEQEDNAGVGTGLRMPYYVTGQVTISVASGTDLSTVTVYIKVL